MRFLLELFLFYKNANKPLVEGDWKLILGKGSGGWTYEGAVTEPEGQLYDLSVDIEEKNNLYLEHPEKVEEMTKMLQMFKDERRSR